MQKIGTIVDWLLLSSKDSDTLSLTFKAVLVWLLAHYGFAYLNLNDALTLIQQSVEYLSAGLTLYGAWRKAITTWRGTNAVLNDPLI